MNEESDLQHSSPRPSEERLLEIRRQAALTQVEPTALVPSNEGAHLSYYGLPVLKQPQWKWEVPVYLFAGGMGGAAAMIAGAGSLSQANPTLVRDARRLATVCGLVSPVLLVADLGKPSRFLNMLRVFKPQSAMSVGSWTLMAFSSSTTLAALTSPLSRERKMLPLVTSAAQAFSSATGLVLATYTGVLVGATAIPVWAENSTLLPFHFGISGLASAVSMLQLAGHDDSRALQALAIGTAAAETMVGGAIELRTTPASRPLKKGTSGWLTRIGGLLSGPLPLILRLIAGGGNSIRSRKLRKVAAVSSVAGSAITRVAWIKAGHASAADPNVVLSNSDGKSSSSKQSVVEVRQ